MTTGAAPARQSHHRLRRPAPTAARRLGGAGDGRFPASVPA